MQLGASQCKAAGFHSLTSADICPDQCLACRPAVDGSFVRHWEPGKCRVSTPVSNSHGVRTPGLLSDCFCLLCFCCHAVSSLASKRPRQMREHMLSVQCSMLRSWHRATTNFSMSTDSCVDSMWSVHRCQSILV